MSIPNTILEIIKINCILGLERKIVGVKFIFNEDDFESIDAMVRAVKDFGEYN